MLLTGGPMPLAEGIRDFSQKFFDKVTRLAALPPHSGLPLATPLWLAPWPRLFITVEIN